MVSSLGVTDSTKILKSIENKSNRLDEGSGGSLITRLSGPGTASVGRHTATAVLGECVVDEQVNDLEDRQHAGAEQQTDETAHLTCTISMQASKLTALRVSNVDDVTQCNLCKCYWLIVTSAALCFDPWLSVCLHR